jgi:magnesium chelatase family protein
LGILAASGQIPLEALDEYEFLGELGLTGELRAVDGVLPAALAAAQAGRKLVVPAGNGAEAALASQVEVSTARTLLEVCAMLDGRKSLPRAEVLPTVRTAGIDLADVRGQTHARRALEIAAAGGHHLLLIGPPGCGKTLLASRLPGLLPEASEAEALETAAIASVSGRGLDPARWRERPFRSPHHTASAVALVGGGAEPRPGEISLAHHGVLFLDELPEWDRRALEVLREPLESGVVTISRAARQSEFPARFQLVAAMNPCPCGWAGDASGRCRCGADAVRRYRARISGPLLDRIDLHVDVPRLPPAELRPNAPDGESSAEVRARVENARALQHSRAGKPNALLSQSETMATCRLTERDHALLERAVDALQLSARSIHRILRVARTIADLGDRPHILTAHLTEALGYRRADRGVSGQAA